MIDLKNKKILSQAEDRISFLYVEKAVVEQTDFSVQIVRKNMCTKFPLLPSVA